MNFQCSCNPGAAPLRLYSLATNIPSMRNKNRKRRAWGSPAFSFSFELVRVSVETVRPCGRIVSEQQRQRGQILTPGLPSLFLSVSCHGRKFLTQRAQRIRREARRLEGRSSLRASLRDLRALCVKTYFTPHAIYQTPTQERPPKCSRKKLIVRCHASAAAAAL